MNELNFWICPTCDSNNCTTGGYCPHCGHHRLHEPLSYMFKFLTGLPVRVIEFPGKPTHVPAAANCGQFPQDAA